MLEFIRVQLNALISDKRGVTAVEYGVIAALIIAAVAAAFSTLGIDIGTAISNVETNL